jgi:hypothetical protein
MSLDRRREMSDTASGATVAERVSDADRLRDTMSNVAGPVAAVTVEVGEEFSA